MVPTPLTDVTEIFPEVPAPTTAEIVVEFTTVKEVAGVPPKLTAVVPVKFVPVKVTVCPFPADVGLKEVIAGAGIKVNPPFEMAPFEVVTLTFAVAPEPTTAVKFVGLTTVNEVAAIPPKLTEVVPVKLVPIIETTAFLPAETGLNEVIVGGGK